MTAGYNPFDLLLQVSEVEARQVRQASSCWLTMVCGSLAAA